MLEDEKEEEEEPAEEKIGMTPLLYLQTVLLCILLFIEPIKKQVTVVVIKPDAVSAGKVDSIIEKVCTA